MAETAPHVLDVTAAEFDQAVLQRSHEVPVLVDFWAPWCGPCRALGPVLEKVAADLDGAVVVAKVNSDENQELSARFGVRGIPAVHLFKDGAVVDQFVGAQPGAKVRAFLRPHCPTAADRSIAEAEAAIEAGDLEAARQAYEQALADDAEAYAARLGLARLTLAAGDLDAAAEHTRAIPARADVSEAAESWRGLIHHVRDALGDEAIDIAAAARRTESDASDVGARFALGAHALIAGQYRQTLEHWLEVAKIDRDWRQQLPRRAMVDVFKVVGVRDPLSDEFRDQLARVYY